MENTFLEYIDGKPLYVGTKVKLKKPDTFGGVSTAVVDNIDKASKVIVLKKCRPANGKHLHSSYKNIKFLYVEYDAFDILEYPKGINGATFKIWW